MKTRVRLWAGIVAVVLALLALTLRLNYVRSTAAGELFWNADGAYLFIGITDLGYRFSYLGRALDEAKEIFPFGVPTPDNKHSSVLVLRVTQTAVQQYYTDNFAIGGGPQPFRGTLYAGNTLRGGLMKWSGTHFDTATPEELEELHQYLAASPTIPLAKPDYDGVQGWSKRTLAGQFTTESPTVPVEKDSTVTVEVEGKQLTFVMNSGFVSGKAYVDLEREGQAAERIWSLDEQPRRVSSIEYSRIFLEGLK